MAEVQCCGNCMFFAEHKGETCVRFPPPQQARVLDDDWCGEYEPRKAPAKPITKQELDYDPYRAELPISKPDLVTGQKPRTKAERLSAFGDLAGRLK